MLLGLATGVLVARVLGPENRGYLAAIVFWPQMLATFLRIPFSNVIVVLKERAGGVEQIARTSLRLALVAFVVSTPFVIFGAAFLLGDASKEHVLLMSLFAIVLVFCSQQTQVFEGVLRATGQFDKVNALRLSVPFAYLVFGAVFAAFGLDLAGFVFAHVLAMAVSYGFRLFIFRNIEMASEQEASQLSSSSILGSASSFYGVSLSMFMTANVDRFFILLVSTPQAVGQYVVAVTVAQPINSIVISMLQSVGLPQLIQMGGDRQVQAFGRLMRATVIVSFSSAVAVAVLAPIVVPLVFGEDFAPAGILTSQLVLVMMFGPVRNAASQLLMAIGRENVVTTSNLAFVLAFAFSFLLSEAAGSGYSVVISFLAGNILALAILLSAIRAHEPLMVSRATFMFRRSDFHDLAAIVLGLGSRFFSGAEGQRQKGDGRG